MQILRTGFLLLHRENVIQHYVDYLRTNSGYWTFFDSASQIYQGANINDISAYIIFKEVH